MSPSTYSNNLTGAGPAWYLIDDTRPLKPIIFQDRKEPQLVSKNQVNDDNVFWEKKAIWGMDGRYVAGYGFPQLAVRSKATLDEDNLSAARTAMRKFVDDKGRRLNVRPTLLVVPPELETTAKKLIALQTTANGGQNVMANEFKLHVSNFLTA
jgi:phage major head subunit gpT-like protein